MELIRITNSSNYVIPNGHFRYLEYFHPRIAPNDIEFEMPKALADGMEVLRGWYNIPMDITSTIRPNDPIGSFHHIGYAVDSVPTDPSIRLHIINDFMQECIKYQNLQGSTLVDNLRSVGVVGYGLEGNNCIHIDTRQSNTCDVDKYGHYIVFEWDKINGSKVIYRKQS